MKKLAVLLLCLSLLTGCATLNKTYLDAEVDRLCAKDGGARIYERIYVTPEQYAKLHEYYTSNLSLDEHIKKTFGEGVFIYKDEKEFIRGSKDVNEQREPQLVRYHDQLIRVSDKKVIAEAVQYYRYGSDGVVARQIGMYPSYYSCPEKDRILGDVLDKIFIKNMNGGQNERH
jgi:hypothetical protein